MASQRAFKRHFITAAWSVLAAVSLAAAPLSAGTPGTWSPKANLNQARAGHTATMLNDGRVLIVGGKDANGTARATAEFFDPATGLYTQVAMNLPVPVWGHTATLLNNGAVLIAGGHAESGNPIPYAQIFDPSTTTFLGPRMLSIARSEHTATLLKDGRVLLAGGTDGASSLNLLEIYDPSADTFSSTLVTLQFPRKDHVAARLDDGKVLVAGGSNSIGALSSAELYDPQTDTVLSAGTLSTPRTQASAALLLDNTVFVAGGKNPEGQDLNTAESYDPTTNTFAQIAATMSIPRSGHVGIRLQDNGRVILAGGTNAGQLITTAEVYDPVTQMFLPVGSPLTARTTFGTNFFAVPYTGGMLATGGQDINQTPLASSELFSYPTLRTDKQDYPPGVVVKMMGEGWQPNETLSILIHENNTDPDFTMTVTADAAGAFNFDAFQTDAADVGFTFIATAAGPASGWTAQAKFMDAGPASDGDGSMSVSPTTVTANSTNTLTFIFTSPSSKDFNAGSQATIVVPTGWTTPTTGNVTVVPGPAPACTSATRTVSGSTITITMNCPSKDQFTVTFSGATAPQTAGTNTFTAQTKQNGGTLKNIASQPVVTVNPAAASKLVFGVQPVDTVAGAPMADITVEVRDAFDNLVTSSSASVTVAITGGGTLNGTTTKSASNGVATFKNLSINKAGTYTLSASSSGLSGATSNTFNITPDAEDHLTFTVQPTNTVAGVSINPAVKVEVRDQFDNLVTGSSASVTIAIGTNPGGGTLSGTTTVAASGGVAMFSNLSIDKTGTGYTLTASSTKVTSATSNGFNITPAAANKLAFGVQPSDTVWNATITPAVAVQVQDSFGNVVTSGTGSNASISIAIGTNPSSGTLSGNAPVTAVSGVATFSNLSINKPGVGYTLSATSTGLTGATSTAFTVKLADTTADISSAMPNPSVYGQTVNFVLTVAVKAPGTGIPTGNVSLTESNNNNVIGVGTLNGGTATIAVSNFTVGTHGGLKAHYLGDSSFYNPSDMQGAAQVTVNQASTKTTITAHTPDPSITGQAVAVNFSVTVNSPGAGTPTGNVTVSDGTVSCIGTVAAGTCNITFTTVGTKNLTATYGGDTNFSGSTSAAVTHTVNPSNTPPTVAATNATVAVNEGSTATNSGTFSDANVGDTVVITASVGSISQIGTNSGTWSWSFGTNDGPAQGQTVTITANDGKGGITTTTFSLTVNNVAPTATFNPPSSVNEGSAISLSLTGASDASTVDTTTGFTYAFDCGDGNGYGPLSATSTASCPTTDNGTRSVKGKVQDKDGGVTEYTGSVPINNVAPTATLGNNGPVNEGSAATISFSSQFDPSSADTAAGFHYAFACDNGSLAAATYAGSGTSTSTSCTFNDNGTLSVRARIIDKDGGYTEYTTVVTVNNVPPTITTRAQNQTADEGTPKPFSLGTFTDPGTADNPWAIDVDWGDASTHTTFALNAVGAIGGQSHSFPDNGTYTVTVKVTDKDGGSDSKTFQVVVANLPPTAAINGAPATSPEGTAINLTSTVTDPSPVDTAAGFTKSWNVTKNGNPYASGTAATISFTPDDNASYVVTFNATDKDGGTGTDTKTITVTNVPPTAAITGAPAMSPEGTPISLGSTVTDPSTVDTAAGFTKSWNVTKNGNPYASGTAATISFTPDDNASYVVTFNATDKDGGTGTDTKTITVLNVAPTNVTVTPSASPINENGSITLAGSFLDPGILDTHTIDIDWGDGSAHTTFALAAGVLSFVSPGHQYLDDNPSGTAADSYTISVSVTDKDGGVGMGTSSVTVNNVAPVITTVTGPTAPLSLNSATATITANFTDVGSQDTHNCVFSWDDGPSTDTVAGSTGSGSCSKAHTWTAAGVYEVHVTVTDDDTGSASSSFQYVVVYDPNGGFVTGGGWINSPAGAYVTNTSLTGKANFGFVSKYQKGATIPVGETEFQFQVANFNFHSSAYQWLVISGPKAQYKGTGTVNGTGDYGFILTATDGQVNGGGGVDKFRIKVWDNNAGGAIVYDNVLGASDDIDSANPQAIGGGSIVVHK